MGNVTYSEHTRPARYCPSCESEHIGQVPCGMTWLARLRSTKDDPALLATRRPAGIYDEDAIDAIFGADSKERMMDETEGVGFTSRAELDAMDPDMEHDVAGFYGADPEDAKVIAGG